MTEKTKQQQNDTELINCDKSAKNQEKFVQKIGQKNMNFEKQNPL